MPCTMHDVGNVVRGFTRRPDLRVAIADLLGKPVDLLWPEFRDDVA